MIDTPLNALLLFGPSLAGNSTVAARLAAEFDAIVVSADEINPRRGLPFGGEGLPESIWAETLRMQLEQLRRACINRRNVVIDDTLCYRWLRDRFRTEASQSGFVPSLLALRPPVAELEARHAVSSDIRN